MLHVTPEYIVLVSNPAEFVVAEDEFVVAEDEECVVAEDELALPLRGYIAATRTSLESWQRFRQREEFELFGSKCAIPANARMGIAVNVFSQSSAKPLQIFFFQQTQSSRDSSANIRSEAIWSEAISYTDVEH